MVSTIRIKIPVDPPVAVVYLQQLASLLLA